jgi:aldose 1-epimerase
MGFGISTREVMAGDRAGTVYVLEDAGGSARAEVWPSHGFNCLRWQVRLGDGSWGDLLYAAPDWEQNPVPTRSGHPILFPFPNRLRHGRFDFAGKTYQLPLNESTGTHAIHGFTPRTPWRIAGAEASVHSAALTGELRLSTDLPGAELLWPADFALAVTYRLLPDRLRVEARVTNPDTRPLPWGIGYHGYFRIPTAAGADVSSYVVRAAGNRLWDAEGNIPTGNRRPVAGETDFRYGRLLGELPLDHLYGMLGSYRADPDGLCEVANLSAPPAPGRLSVWVSAEFRELLLFTPPHRRAVAVEPYTCATDAASLASAGIDSGWVVLPPGGSAGVVVEYRWEANSQAGPAGGASRE